ncbi:hypothetical protein [Sphingobacterium bovistauri]|uniref:Methane oxygenase PmoA n=1 Tax=Sphingobacterium bovistauri TaxID=2781959 RepID=A0ABS7Z341_9SPHI|nr:hypothetical protein [Sphingobacterium bovistauri]MCA5004383.1 hypothetical protein [Sphingobacterium bovistauri]
MTIDFKYSLGAAFLTILTLGCTTQSHTVTHNDKKAFEASELFFKNEVKPKAHYPCFPGAYYRKAVSSKDLWVGVKGKVTLPTIIFDESRKHPNKSGQYLDNPSVYMGGLMDKQETDIGLTWEVIKYEDGTVSKERKAFRPFFRRTDHKSGQKSIWVNAPASKEYYWYPGEEVEMSVEVVADGMVKIVVDGAGKRYEDTFECAGYTLDGIGEFKRVNAIDQFRNEGKPAQPTKTIVKDAKWEYTTLIRQENGKRLDVPMHTGRMTDMRCPEIKFFNIITTEANASKGAEVINISGQGY